MPCGALGQVHCLLVFALEQADTLVRLCLSMYLSYWDSFLKNIILLSISRKKQNFSWKGVKSVLTSSIYVYLKIRVTFIHINSLN